MRSAIVSVGVLAGVVALSCTAAARDRKAKEAYYSILLVTSADGGVAYEVVEADKVTVRRGELMNEYKGALKTWYAEAADFRKDAANRGKKFEKPQPSMPFVEVAKTNVRGRKAADEFVAKMEGRHCVIRIKDGDGKTSFEAVQSSKLNARKTKMEAEYADALKAWDEGAAAFKKENPGKTYAEPRPKKPLLTVVRKDLEDRAAAEAEVAKLQGDPGKKDPPQP